MKKMFSMLSVLILMLSFAACTGNPSVSPAATTSPTTEQLNATTETQNVTTFPETTAKPVITDYSITGMMNVTDVYFSAKNANGYYHKVDPKVDNATAFTVEFVCPECDEEQVDIVDLSEMPENLIGQQTFTWTNEVECDYWYDHDAFVDTKCKFSLMFTLAD